MDIGAPEKRFSPCPTTTLTGIDNATYVEAPAHTGAMCIANR